MQRSRLKVNRADMSRMPLLRFTGSFAATGAVLGLVCALAGCTPPPPPDGPPSKTLAKADPIVVAVQPTAEGVRVIARVAGPDLAGDSIRAAATAVRQLARAIQNNAADLPPGARKLTFDLYGMDVDKFGKRSPSRFFETDFYVDDLHALDLKTKGPAGVLTTAIDLHIDTAGIDPINAWCMRYPHAAGNFCSMAGD